MIKFSIVIPIYNTEATIERCVDSALKQTYRNVEIILVDDGSTDGSGAICDHYLQYESIKVVHKVNGGLSSARNAGIQEASGEYVLFLDADDYLDEIVCESIYDAVVKGNHPDCIDFGIRYVYSKGEYSQTNNQINKNVLLDYAFINEKIIPSLLPLRNDSVNTIWEYVCNKAYKLELIKRNNLLFDSTRRIWEDKPFLLNYLRFCNSYYSLDNCFYYYVNTAGSLSGRYDLQFFDIILTNYTWYKEWYGDRFDFDTSFVNGYWCRSIESMIFRSLEQTENNDVIEHNIISTLQLETVKNWYRKRQPENKWEEKANCLMQKNEIDDLIPFYKDWLINKQKEEKKNNSLINRTLKRIKRKISI